MKCVVIAVYKLNSSGDLPLASHDSPLKFYYEQGFKALEEVFPDLSGL